MQSVQLLLLAGILSAMPAQTRQVSRNVAASSAGRAGKGMVLEQHSDACVALTETECCAQLLEIAGFRATGDQLPKKAKTPLRLSCEAPEKVFPEMSCRLLAMSRGFDAKQSTELCAPATLQRRCRDDEVCRQCTDDLGKLAWRSPHRACYALTYKPPRRRNAATVITLTHGDTAAPGGSSVRMRRSVVR